MKLSVVSGGFDPLHIGHLELFERSAAMADKLFVIVNTDQFLTNKKGKPFYAAQRTHDDCAGFEAC